MLSREFEIIHSPVEYSSITMATPPKKLSVEDRAAYLKDQARLAEEAILMDSNQRRLKQEGISCLEETRNSRWKRKRKDDEVSVVTASKRPKAIQGHNNFETSSHWNTPTHKRQSKKPTDIYKSKMNNVGSSTSTIADSPLAATRT